MGTPPGERQTSWWDWTGWNDWDLAHSPEAAWTYTSVFRSKLDMTDACTFGRPRAPNGDTCVRGPVIRTLLKNSIKKRIHFYCETIFLLSPLSKSAYHIGITWMFKFPFNRWQCPLFCQNIKRTFYEKIHTPASGRGNGAHVERQFLIRFSLHCAFL